MTKNPSIVLEKRLFVAVLIAVIFTGTLTIMSLIRSSTNRTTTSIFCTFEQNGITPVDDTVITPTQYTAILHYATTSLGPQQTPLEISVTLDLLRSIGPCNFLIFGLGHDSLMWSSFNPRGNTLFLEDDMKWVHKIINQVPTLRVHQVSYNTRLSESDDLISSYRFVSNCVPPKVSLKGNSKCKLALSDMADEVYEKEWDVILIDGPKNYLGKSPGRMTVIFSAAVMARGRKRSGVTHVVVHDAHRRVDRIYAEEFLCKKYLVKTQGRLWHFAIPPNTKFTHSFC